MGARARKSYSLVQKVRRKQAISRSQQPGSPASVETRWPEPIGYGCLVLDAGLRIEFINTSARELFTGGDLQGADFWSVLPEEQHSGFRREFTRAQQSGRVVKFDQFVPELGRWYLLSVHPMPEDRLLVFLRDTSTDVEEDYRTRTLLQHSADGLLLLNADLSEQYHHNVLWDSRSRVAEQATHLSCIHPQDQERFRSTCLGLAAGAGVRLRYRLRVPGSGWRWLEARITNRLADPGTRALVVNYRDVTAEQRARAEI